MTTAIKTPCIEKQKNPSIDDFLKKTFPCQKNEKLDIRPLWNNVYRLNFWEQQKVEGCSVSADNKIVRSIFVVLKVVEDGFEVIEEK